MEDIMVVDEKVKKDRVDLFNTSDCLLYLPCILYYSFDAPCKGASCTLQWRRNNKQALWYFIHHAGDLFHYFSGCPYLLHLVPGEDKNNKYSNQDDLDIVAFSRSCLVYPVLVFCGKARTKIRSSQSGYKLRASPRPSPEEREVPFYLLSTSFK